jgi:hypothetical protein
MVRTVPAGSHGRSRRKFIESLPRRRSLSRAPGVPSCGERLGVVCSRPNMRQRAVPPFVNRKNAARAAAFFTHACKRVASSSRDFKTAGAHIASLLSTWLSRPEAVCTCAWLCASSRSLTRKHARILYVIDQLRFLSTPRRRRCIRTPSRASVAGPHARDLIYSLRATAFIG